MGDKPSINQVTLALSSILESFCLLTVGFIIILIGFFKNYLNFSILDHVDVNIKKLLFLFALGGCFFILIYFIYNKHLSEAFRVFSIQRVGHLVRLWIFYSLFLLISSVTLFCIFSFMFKSDLKMENLPIIICANVFAWMGGFITPGAPGGLGVREALLTMLLSEMLPISIIIGGVIIFRIITLFGEVSAVCIAICFFKSPFERIERNE